MIPVVQCSYCSSEANEYYEILETSTLRPVCHMCKLAWRYRLPKRKLTKQQYLMENAARMLEAKL